MAPPATTAPTAGVSKPNSNSFGRPASSFAVDHNEATETAAPLAALARHIILWLTSGQTRSQPRRHTRR
jgi:hypothetical protein